MIRPFYYLLESLVLGFIRPFGVICTVRIASSIDPSVTERSITLNPFLKCPSPRYH